MSSYLSQSTFAGLWTLLVLLSTSIARCEPLPMAARIDKDAVVVTVAGKLFTQYKFGSDLKKPYLWPLAGPSTGTSVTVESPKDHPHHNSMWFACDRLNGRDYWHHQNPGATIFSRGPVIEVSQGPEVVFTDICEWTPRSGDILASPTMLDLRRITVRAPDAATRLIDFQITWLPLVDVTITKTNHSLFALRMLPVLSVKSGGVMINAQGGRGEKATFGKSAPWMDYYGTHDGKVEGAAILQHPSNRWYPSPWFTRDYGFFSPTPMQWLKTPLSLPRGKPVVLAYRVVVHAGTHEDAAIARRFAEFAEEPAPIVPDVSQVLLATCLGHLDQACAYRFGETRRHLARLQAAVALASAGDETRRSAVSRRLGTALDSPATTPAARRFLCTQLGLLGRDEAVPVLARQLQANDGHLAETAILALGRIRTPDAVAALERAIGKLPQRLQRTAVSALGAMGDAGVAALTSRLTGPVDSMPLSSKTHWRAAVLRRSRTHARPSRTTALQEDSLVQGTSQHRLIKEDEVLGEAAILALGRAGTTQAVHALHEGLQAATGEQRRALEDALLRALGKTDTRVDSELASDVCRGLGQSGLSGSRGVALLVAAIRFLPAAERRELVVQALAGSDSVLRQGAIGLAAGAADARLTHAACAVFAELTGAEQVVLLHALAQRGDAEFAAVARQGLDSVDVSVQTAACSALSGLGNAGDVPVLLGRIGQGDGVGTAAKAALARIAVDGVSGVIGKAMISGNSANRRDLLDLLIERADAESIQWYMAAIRDADRRVREVALRGIGEQGTRGELAALLDLLNGDLGNADYRNPFEACVASLCRKFAEDISASAPCLSALPKATVPGRASLLRVLGILGEEAGLSAIVQYLASTDESVRDAGVRALAAWPDVNAWGPLLDTARETDSLIHHVLALRGCRRLLGMMTDREPEELKKLYDTALAIARRDEEKRLFIFRLKGIAVRDLKVASKGTYRVLRGGMRKGAVWATDRHYKFSEVPAELLGATYIQTVMNDKVASDKADFMNFRVEEPAAVYVGFDNRCRKLPEWLGNWEKMGLVVREETNSCHLVVYRKAFPIGKVVIGGNKAPGVAAIYTVVVAPDDAER